MVRDPKSEKITKPTVESGHEKRKKDRKGQVKYFGEYDVPNPPVPNRAHTEMSLNDEEK